MNVQLRTPHATSRRFNSKSESTGQPADDDESRDDGETDTSSPEIRRVSAPALPMKVTTPAAREITTPVTVIVKKMSPTNRGHEQSSENVDVPHQQTSISPTKSVSVPSGKENTRPTAPALSSDHPSHQSNQFRGGRGRSHRGRGGRWRGRQNHNKTPGTPVRSGNQA